MSGTASQRMLQSLNVMRVLRATSPVPTVFINSFNQLLRPASVATLRTWIVGPTPHNAPSLMPPSYPHTALPHISLSATPPQPPCQLLIESSHTSYLLLALWDLRSKQVSTCHGIKTTTLYSLESAQQNPPAWVLPDVMNSMSIGSIKTFNFVELPRWMIFMRCQRFWCISDNKMKQLEQFSSFTETNAESTRPQNWSHFLFNIDSVTELLHIIFKNSWKPGYLCDHLFLYARALRVPWVFHKSGVEWNQSISLSSRFFRPSLSSSQCHRRLKLAYFCSSPCTYLSIYILDWPWTWPCFSDVDWPWTWPCFSDVAIVFLLKLQC